MIGTGVEGPRDCQRWRIYNVAIGVGKRHSRVGRQWWFLKLALVSHDENFLVDTRPLHILFRSVR